MSRRKVEMILELVDRATRPARRFIALQRRMGAAVERANRIATRTARLAGRATDLYKRAVQGLGRAQDALQRGIRRSNDLIRRQVTQMRMATGMMRGGVMGMGRAALLAGGMFTAYAGTVSLAGTAMLGPARQFEKFQTILTTTEGTAEAAQEAMSWVQDFAVSTPYELEQVMGAFVQLRSYGLDPTNGLLRTLGDTSAAMGKDVMQAVEAIADAVTGENERLKEFGVTTSKVGDYFEYSYNVDGVSKTVRALASDRAAIEAALTGIFNERFGGAMELQAQTFDRMLSNIMDQWSKFQLMIMSNGVFDWMKSKMRLVLDELDRLSESGELEAWAKAIADNILTGLKAIWEFGAASVRFWKALYPWLQSAADALGGWRNLALAVLAIPFRGVILGAAFSLLQFAGGAALAMKALAGIGFGSAATGAMWFGKALLGLANPINWVKGAFMALRVALIATGIGALVVGLAMAGVWIYNNWSGLKSFFKGFGEAFMKSLGPARPLAEGVINVVRRLWDWIGKLLAPLDASAEQWAEWGRAAGRVVGDAVASVRRFVGRIGEWFGRLRQVNWRELFSMATLRTAWASVKNWLGERLSAIWDGLTSIEWSDLLTLQGLMAAWTGITNWVTTTAANLWDLLSPLSWVGLVKSNDLANAWTAVTDFVTGTAASLWSSISELSWVERINDSGLARCWGKVTTFLGTAGSTVWDAITRFTGWCDAIDKEGLKAAWAGAKEWFGGVATTIWDAVTDIDWQARIDGLQEAWTTTTTFLSGVGATLWAGIESVKWADLVSGLSDAWNATVGFLAEIGSTLWAGITEIKWADLISGLGAAWTSAVGFLGSIGASLWDNIDPIAWGQLIVAIPGNIWTSVMNFSWKDVLPDWDWAAIIPDAPDMGGYFSDDIGDRLWWRAQGRGSLWGPWEEGKTIIEDLQAQAITTSQAMALLEAEANGGEWAGRAERMLTMLREAEGIQPPQISDPETLLEAARAAEQLETQFPAINAAALEALTATTDTLNGISILLSGIDYASEGARLMQTLADGIRSKVAEVTAAAMEITRAIRNALPRSATMQVGLQGGGAVQARASGGSFGAGWLLTGENGPELEYRNRGGYIAHNRALQNMVAMSGTVARNAANANRTPSWLKSAALASGIAASAAIPAAAEDAVDVTDMGTATNGAQYLNLQNSGPRPPDAPISVSMTFTGKVDREVMPDIRAMKEELLEELQDLLEDSGRAAQRREHE